MSGSATAPWAFDKMPVFHAKRIAQKERNFNQLIKLILDFMIN